MALSLIKSSIPLARAGFKLRVEGNYLGILWYLLDPLMMFCILMFIRNITGAGIEHYPLYLLMGLNMFNFFRKTTIMSANCLIRNAGLITSLKTRPEVFVIASCLQTVFDHVFEILIFAGLMVYFKISLVYLIIYPVVFIVFFLFVSGVSFMLAPIGVYINDIDNVWNVLTRLLWFATPIFYSARLKLPFNVNIVNPMYYFITVARELIIYHRVPEWRMMAGITFISLLTLIIGYTIFQRLKPRIAEKL